MLRNPPFKSWSFKVTDNNHQGIYDIFASNLVPNVIYPDQSRAYPFLTNKKCEVLEIWLYHLTIVFKVLLLLLVIYFAIHLSDFLNLGAVFVVARAHPLVLADLNDSFYDKYKWMAIRNRYLLLPCAKLHDVRQWSDDWRHWGDMQYTRIWNTLVECN